MKNDDKGSRKLFGKLLVSYFNAAKNFLEK